MATAETTISERVTLDGKTFNDINFEGATLVYAGGTPPSFNNCRFNNATFSFDGAAGNTLAFLKAMAPAHTNMRGVVQGLIPELND